MFAGTWGVIAALIVGLVMTLRRMRRTEARYSRLVEGASGEKLEEILLEHIGQIRHNEQALGRIAEDLARHDLALQGAVQNIGLVRFNPFNDTGGQFSFALALADIGGSGLVLSSLHGRDGSRLYVKPLRGWSSSVQLSDEEREAVQLAQQNDTGDLLTMEKESLDKIRVVA